MKRGRIIICVLLPVSALLATTSVALATTSSLTINATGTVSPAAFQATVTGTITCTQGDTVDIPVAVRQGLGVHAQAGENDIVVTCSGGTDPWSVTVFGGNPGAVYKPGKAAVIAQALDFTDGTMSPTVERIVKLSK
jgi:hypothetical protein